MSKIVIFYSRADENYFRGKFHYVEVGNTEKAAKIIAKLTGSDMLRIEQKTPYSADYKTCVAEARKDNQENARPELTNLPEDLNGYDEIYLGYPNYCSTMPMAVYTFLEAFDFSGKTIYPFCTHEGSGISGTEKDIESAAKNSKVAKGLAIFGSDVEDSENIIKEWLS